MSVTRSCLPCRTAKAKCDLARPTCSRCRQRGLVCSGFPADGGFLFRNENESARRNSQRARRDRTRLPGQAPVEFFVIPQQQQQEDVHLRQWLPWLHVRALAEVPKALKKDVDARAVDRFFVNWTLNPCNDDVSRGYMSDLPLLYHSAPAESVLWLAVRAVAFADMSKEVGGTVAFRAKARRTYGAALSSVRALANDENSLLDDRALAAILLIDDFELMYLRRQDLLGPHNEAISHILHARGDAQLLSRWRFDLWRVAYQRLLIRQLVRSEEPSEEQIAWMDKLDTSRPNVRIWLDVLRMNSLSAKARRLLQNQVSETRTLETADQARGLASSIRCVLDEVESGTSAMAAIWKPDLANPQQIVPATATDAPNLPMPVFPCPRFLNYHDIWLAHVWNFHAASQIFLRESLVDLINSYSRSTPAEEDIARIQSEKLTIDRLSAATIRSYPMLLGFTHRYEGMLPRAPPQGKMVGRLFSLFSMWVIQRAKFSSAQHKKTAGEVTEWIKSCHGLD